MANRKIPEINAGSMADIAFLLLVFFLVTTTIQTDAGLLVTLPQWVDDPIEPQEKNKRNVLQVLINGADQLLVNEAPMNVENLQEKTLNFILNYGKDETMSISPQKAVISLQNDNATSYDIYVQVYNELQAAYNKIWESESQKRFNRPYKSLTKDERLEIRNDFPQFISEAEPTEFKK